MKNLQRDRIPALSKSRFMAGLQCLKRLYLESYHRDLADPITEQQQAIFDIGNEVGELARGLYPGGVLIKESYLQHKKAIESTVTALSTPGIPALFEAAFLYDDVRVRADLLVRAGNGGFDLIEVKSTTQVKEEHVPDAAIQAYVLNNCGIEIRHACIGHLNKEYIYQGGDYDLKQLFRIEDITNEVQEIQPGIPSILDAIKQPLWATEPPDIKTGKQCFIPYQCPFYGYCHADEPEHHISQLPRASKSLLQSLEEAGIEEIPDIPDDFAGLNAIQKRVRDCVVNNYCYLDSELPQALQKLEYPVHFLDFETFSPALPIYVGTCPYQIIPFQWSDHILEESGELRHEEFLHKGTDDPREAFAKSLLKTLGTRGSIVVYSGFEAARIRELAVALPALSAELLGLLDDRIVDLFKLIRNYCYHPEFHGSFSIKSVLPALVPGMDYKDLEINNGGMASDAYAEIIRPETSPARRDFLRESLLKYCKRDTEAEVRLFQVLREPAWVTHRSV